LALQDDLLTSADLARFFTHRVLDGVPFIFSGDRASYVEWRSELAEAIHVDAHGIVMVGSAAYGVSLGPGRNFAAFGSHSDVDVGVVSQHHFELAWRFFRNLGTAARLRLPKKVQISFLEHAPRDVYFGVIATERFLPHLPFGPEWARTLAVMSARDPTKDRNVKVRLYRDVESLRAYQVRSLGLARRSLLEQAAGGV
jgi:hypothetical protein